MHEQHAIDCAVRQRHFLFVDQSGEARAIRGPFHDALCARHESEAALSLLAEQAEIGRDIADAEHALAAHVTPAAADAAADETARHHAEVLAVEVAQVDHVYRHGGKLA